MRVNIYAQEITDRVELVLTTAKNTGNTFLGIRFYLDSPASLQPPQHIDDDSSAVTFWVKSGREGYTPGDEEALISILERAVDLLRATAEGR